MLSFSSRLHSARLGGSFFFGSSIGGPRAGSSGGIGTSSSGRSAERSGDAQRGARFVFIHVQEAFVRICSARLSPRAVSSADPAGAARAR